MRSPRPIARLSRALRPPAVALPPPRRLAAQALLVGPALAASTVGVWLLEGPAFGIADASAVYLVAVVLAGSRFGTWPALLTAVAAFLVYDVLFTEPRLSLVVADAREWLDLLLFLFVAVGVGRLSALGSERAREASERAREATALFAIGRTLATEPDLETAAPAIAALIVRETGLARVWIGLEHGGRTVVVADSSAGRPLPESAFSTTLARTPGEAPARWVRAHEPGPAGNDPRPTQRSEILRVRMEADGLAVGSVRALHDPAAGRPSPSTTRLLALAADQLALAVRRDDLRRAATEAEIARRSDALKTALLDAVSHDLRTPLASIRAAAGTLIDPDVPLSAESSRATALSIDLEAERLDRLVREVLDLSRIEAGVLRPELEALDLPDIVEPIVDRFRPLLGERPVTVALPDDLPPVRADAVLVDGLVSNLLENVARHAPPPAALEVRAWLGDGSIELTVDDAGPGVPAPAMGRLFEKFHRVERSAGGARRGLGLGLTVVRGLAEAMNGSAAAEPSPLGGLRIRVSLPVAGEPPGDGLPSAQPAAVGSGDPS